MCWIGFQWAEQFLFPLIFIYLGVLTISSNSKEVQINEEIRDKEVRVIDNDGTQLGIMSAKEALAIAEEKELLVINEV